MTRPSRPTALLLDLDGTLVDSEPAHRAAYRACFAARGWSVPDLSPFTGRRAADVFGTEPGPWQGVDPQALAAEVMTHLPPDVVPEPVAGAQELVESAVLTGVPLAVVTSAGPAWVRRALGPLLRHVDAVVTAADVTHGKPHPAGYALALTRLEVPPAGSVAVEDSPAGVLAAAAAGVGSVHGVATTHTPEELRVAGAELVHDDLRPLPAALGLLVRSS